MSHDGTIKPDSEYQSAIRTALGRWSGDSRFGTRLSPVSGIFVVLDETGRRLLHASDGARPLAAAVADARGCIVPGLRLADQVGAARLAFDRPILVRLRLDPRGVASPTMATVVRTASPDGEAVLILALSGPLPRLRPLAAEAPAPPSAAQEPGPAPAMAAPEPDTATATATASAGALEPLASVSGGTASQRFVWRSDAVGTVTQVTGPAGHVLRDVVVDRSWRAMAEAGVLLDAEGLLRAIDDRRTFRAIPVTVMRGGGAGPLDLEMSGSPLDRSGGGFGGFGIFRLPSSSAEPPPLPDPLLPIEPSALASPSETDAWVEDAILDATIEPPRAIPADLHLSSHEHDAFREIARALGARFAGDDAPTAEEAGGTEAEPGRPCAVMPFPAQPPRSVEPVAGDPDAAVVATLERLPTGVLIYRGDAILFANRPLITLAGFDGFAELVEAGGVGRLFRGPAPHERAEDDAPAILTRRDGRSLGVDLQRSAIDWGGAPAELLLARDATPGDALRQSRAAAIAEDFVERRGADALGALDVIDDGIVTVDANDRILSLNRAAATILALDPREVVGASFLSLFATENAVDVLAILHGVPGPASLAPSEVREVAARTRENGHPLQMRVFPLAAGGERRLCAVIRDVTTTRRIAADALNARRAADAASEQKSSFLAKVSHEIRTPIGGILGLTDLMLSEQFGPLGSERYSGYLGDIRAAGAHVLELVDDLLDLARIEAGHLDLTLTEIPLNEIVARCVALLQPQAARDRIVVRTSFSEDLATLTADERSIRQAALNVIANAIAFTEPGGQVIVSTTMADRGEIALRVRDTGIGMTPDEVETALQPFRQVGTVGPRKGTGLGLPLTKALVEANRGRFRISSRKSEGTLVEMLFPAAARVRSA